MLSNNYDNSDEEYEEIDDFDGEFSVFGSDQVVEKKESVLGKRNRGEQQVDFARHNNAATLYGGYK